MRKPPSSGVHSGGLTFAAAAAAPQTPSDDQTDGILRRRGPALCCQGNGALGRWRKWTSILRWETMTTGVKICGTESVSSYCDSAIAHTFGVAGFKGSIKKKKLNKTPTALFCLNMHLSRTLFKRNDSLGRLQLHPLTAPLIVLLIRRCLPHRLFGLVAG